MFSKSRGSKSEGSAKSNREMSHVDTLEAGPIVLIIQGDAGEGWKSNKREYSPMYRRATIRRVRTRIIRACNSVSVAARATGGASSLVRIAAANSPGGVAHCHSLPSLFLCARISVKTGRQGSTTYTRPGRRKGLSCVQRPTTKATHAVRARSIRRKRPGEPCITPIPKAVQRFNNVRETLLKKFNFINIVRFFFLYT